jgi:ABC-type antimicrobial peptide transport system permease subunit
VLACVGVYGVMAYAMAQRRYELGVRLALGARPSQVLALAVGEGARLTALGIVVGTLVAAVAASALRGQLYGVSPRDVTTYAIAIGVIGAAALVASWLPAWRAASASAIDVLRSD